MPRYIDADRLLTKIHELYVQPNIELWQVVKCVGNSPTADVVPKSEVERLNAELVRVQARHPFAMTLFELEACEKHAAIEAIKEVWRELRSKCDAPHWCVWLSEIDDYFEKKTGVKTEDIAELKKKYAESENG
jgi:hypothetical protein